MTRQRSTRCIRLRLFGVAGSTAALGILILAGHARAESPPPPSPVGEDVSFVMLGAVGERVSIDFYRAAAKAKVLDAHERKRLLRMGNQKAKRWAKLNAALGEDALTDEDFVTSLPDDALRSPRRIARFGERLERLLTGVYLSGVRNVVDPATRLLLARQLTLGMQNLAWLRALRGADHLRVPAPVSVSYAGIQFDRLLATPGVEPS